MSGNHALQAYVINSFLLSPSLFGNKTSMPLMGHLGFFPYHLRVSLPGIQKKLMFHGGKCFTFSFDPSGGEVVAGQQGLHRDQACVCVCVSCDGQVTLSRASSFLSPVGAATTLMRSELQQEEDGQSEG